MTRSAISLDGPFFRKDPRKTLRQNGRVLLHAIDEIGAEDVIAQYRSGESDREPISNGVSPDRVSGHVVGRITALSGRPWQVHSVVSVVPAGGRTQAVALMAAASRVEGETHAMRKTLTRLRRSRKINAAELLKGLT